MNRSETSITDSQLNEIDALFADLEWIDFKRPVWKAVRARLAAAEADADRLADYGRALRKARFALCNMDEPPIRRDEALALHDEAVALRERPS